MKNELESDAEKLEFLNRLPEKIHDRAWFDIIGIVTIQVALIILSCFFRPAAIAAAICLPFLIFFGFRRIRLFSTEYNNALSCLKREADRLYKKYANKN